MQSKPKTKQEFLKYFRARHARWLIQYVSSKESLQVCEEVGDYSLARMHKETMLLAQRKMKVCEDDIMTILTWMREEDETNNVTECS